MNAPRIIAFTGLAQAGKTTCAGIVTNEYGHAPLSFATPLKHAAETLLGLSHEDLYTAIGKERQVERLGCTPREALQQLGSFCRDTFGKDVFADAGMRLAAASSYGAVFDDLRYPNEAEAVRAAGGIVVGVRRIGQTSDDEHESERVMRERWWDIVDVQIMAHDGKIEALKAQILDIVEGSLPVTAHASRQP